MNDPGIVCYVPSLTTLLCLGDNRDPVFTSSSYSVRKMHLKEGRDLLKLCWARWACAEQRLGLGRLLGSRALCDNSSHPLVPLNPQKDFTLILSFGPHLGSKVLQEIIIITMSGGQHPLSTEHMLALYPTFLM